MRLIAAIAFGYALYCGACRQTGGAVSLVGRSCKSASDCDVNVGVCITDGKDGMCAIPCQAAGEAGQCLVGAYCTRGSFTTGDAGMTDMTLCLPSCKQDKDCRDGYACNAVSEGPGKVCEPK